MRLVKICYFPEKEAEIYEVKDEMLEMFLENIRTNMPTQFGEIKLYFPLQNIKAVCSFPKPLTPENPTDKICEIESKPDGDASLTEDCCSCPDAKE